MASATAIALLFAAMSLVMTSERSDFERRIIAAFEKEVKGPSDQADCMKVETYHFTCRAGERTYDLTYTDLGCWRARAKDPLNDAERVSGCLNERS